MESFGISIGPLNPGRYIVAVSGGVDSMVLLDVLKNQSGLELIVAHFDHGIRSDSRQDREFVQQYAMSHNLPFEFDEGNLESHASEAKARTARYFFLRLVCKKYNAVGIIMAHHQNDLLETALINLIRGTGRRGLGSLRSHTAILRPLLHITKQRILAYARAQGLPWREDSTNLDQSHLRNFVRHSILPKASAPQQKKLHQIIVRQQLLNHQIDQALDAWLEQHAAFTKNSAALPRYLLIMLPQHIAIEILQRVLKRLTGRTAERQLAEIALLFIKTAPSHKLFLLSSQRHLRVSQREVIVEPHQPVVS